MRPPRDWWLPRIAPGPKKLLIWQRARAGGGHRKEPNETQLHPSRAALGIKILIKAPDGASVYSTVPVKRHRGEPGHTGTHGRAHGHTDHTDEPHKHGMKHPETTDTPAAARPRTVYRMRRNRFADDMSKRSQSVAKHPRENRVNVIWLVLMLVHVLRSTIGRTGTNALHSHARSEARSQICKDEEVEGDGTTENSEHREGIKFQLWDVVE